jgi:uncharacterized tellurite resistance protein B-like protein
MKDVRVLDTWVAELTTNAHFDVLTVRITASAVDYREDLRTGRRLSGTTRPGEFTEYWSLLRRRDAKTVADKPGLLEGHCPNCGAEVSVNASSRCEYCQAHLTSCAKDWVLSEITQASVWQPTAGREVPGFDRLASRDAGLTLQHVEDRASVMVYRRFAAAREARVEPLACIATPEYVRQFTAELPAPDAPDRTWYGDCSVGSVETVGMIPTREADVALVRVRWSATRLGHDSGEIREVAEGGTFAALFVLTRRPDAVTNVDETVSSAHCPACGAPAEGARGGSCAFCGTVLNDGSDWLLAATPSLGSSQAGTLIARARALGAQSTVSGARAREARSGAPAQRGLLAWLVSISISDGQVDRAQRRSLRALAHKCAVPEEELDRMIEGARSGNTEPPRPESGSQARQWLTEMVRLALSDGRIHRKERRVLRDVGEELSMSAYDVDQLITKEKLALARRARQDIDREHRSRRRDPSLAAAM